MSVVYPAAKLAVVALDALNGYLQNGSEGALTALVCDAVLSVKDARMLREVDKSFDQKMIDYPTAPSDNTDVK